MAQKHSGDDPPGQLWGTVVREAIATSLQATPFGKTTEHGLAYQLPSRIRDDQTLAIAHLLEAVALLQTLVKLLADELDRREVPTVATPSRASSPIDDDKGEASAKIFSFSPHQPFDGGVPAG